MRRAQEFEGRRWRREQLEREDIRRQVVAQAQQEAERLLRFQLQKVALLDEQRRLGSLAQVQHADQVG